jgi:hypothetical protein
VTSNHLRITRRNPAESCCNFKNVPGKFASSTPSHEKYYQKSEHKKNMFQVCELDFKSRKKFPKKSNVKGNLKAKKNMRVPRL